MDSDIEVDKIIPFIGGKGFLWDFVLLIGINPLKENSSILGDTVFLNSTTQAFVDQTYINHTKYQVILILVVLIFNVISNVVRRPEGFTNSMLVADGSDCGYKLPPVLGPVQCLLIGCW